MNKARTKLFFILATCFSLAFTTAPIGNAAATKGEGQTIAQVTISKEQAKSIALQQVKGRVIHIDLDTDNGVQKYEVIIVTDQNEVYEVEINANTGQVIKVEKEND